MANSSRIKRIYQALKASLFTTDGISTEPHYESYSWGKNKSLFAQCLYFFVYVVRFLSPLQRVKKFYRSYTQGEQNDTKERKDFHARHTEWYLLFVFLFAVGYYSFSLDILDIPSAFYAQQIVDWTLWSLVVLLLVESVFWVFYYMLLRVLIERHLQIFNEAEYMVVLPLVIATQFFLAAGLLGVSVSEVAAITLSLDFDAPESSPSAQMLLGVFGYIYTALIIANIINLVPKIPVLARPNLTIIGAGDVVSQRVIPAALNTKLYKPQQLFVIASDIQPKVRRQLEGVGIKYRVTKESKCQSVIVEEVVKFIKKRSSFAVIATPTDSHLAYMMALSNEGIAYAVEKPLAAAKGQIALLKDNPQILNKGFVLSYYWLEKALPLNYFINLTPQYRKFLSFSRHPTSTSNEVTASYLEYLRISLGKLQKVDIQMHEMREERYWAISKETGGFFYETLIHPVTLLHQVLGEDIDFNLLESKWGLSNNAITQYNCGADDLGATQVALTGITENGVEISVSAGKYQQRKRRHMTLLYAQGRIDMNLDTLCCEIYSTSENCTLTINVKPEFAGIVELDDNTSWKAKYLVQLNLFDQFIRAGCQWQNRYDDFPAQLTVLQKMANWLEQQHAEQSFYQPIVLDAEDNEQ